MIDFHTHILPGIDDGSRSSDMSIEMLKLEHMMGVDTVICTPHFYAHRDKIHEFLERRDRALEKVKTILTDPMYSDLPEVRVGAEVYYFIGIGRAEHIKELSIVGTDIILIELPFRPWDREVLNDLRDLRRKQRLKVILAHVERYRDLQKDKGLYEEVLDNADIIQMNAGSFIEAGLLKRRNLFKIADSGRKLIMGSDCHNVTTRRPNLKEGFEIIEKKLGEEKVIEINETLNGLFR